MPLGAPVHLMAGLTLSLVAKGLSFPGFPNANFAGIGAPFSQASTVMLNDVSIVANYKCFSFLRAICVVAVWRKLERVILKIGCMNLVPARRH